MPVAYCMRWLLWCFCLLAESYETINHWPPLQVACHVTQKGIMQRSNQFSVKIKINENTMAEKLINVNEGCHGVLKVGLETHFCESRFRRLQISVTSLLPWDLNIPTIWLSKSSVLQRVLCQLYLQVRKTKAGRKMPEIWNNFNFEVVIKFLNDPQIFRVSVSNFVM